MVNVLFIIILFKFYSLEDGFFYKVKIKKYLVKVKVFF